VRIAGGSVGTKLLVSRGFDSGELEAVVDLKGAECFAATRDAVLSACVAVCCSDQLVENSRFGIGVTCSFDQVKLCSRPRFMESVGISRRARHVIASMNDGTGDVGNASRIAQ
jgi:hypothetical protein